MSRWKSTDIVPLPRSTRRVLVASWPDGVCWDDYISTVVDAGLNAGLRVTVTDDRGKPKRKRITRVDPDETGNGHDA